MDLGIGTVRFGEQIDKAGYVINVRVMESTGNGDKFGRCVLDNLALDISHRKFHYPYARDGMYFTETLMFGSAK